MIFDFLCIKLDPIFTAHVSAKFVAKEHFPVIDSRVAALCEELTARLVAISDEQEAQYIYEP